MNRDIVYNEDEISIAKNQIQNYVDFLYRCINEYTVILNEMATYGINDQKVCSKIFELKNQLAPYKSNIDLEGDNLKSRIDKSVNEIVFVDKSTFSGEFMSSINNVLSLFTQG